MTMSDLIKREDVLELLNSRVKSSKGIYGDLGGAVSGVRELIKAMPSAEPESKWIPVTEALPEDKDWYLGIFKESDTGYCISVPFVCYYAGRKTMITTKDYWILRGYDDIYSFSEYFRNLECAAWMPLPEPWRGEE